MKKLYFLLLCLVSLTVFSQKDYSRYYNSWRLGLNLGGAWQTADYRSCWGIAGGITLEKGFHENATNFFSFAIRGRYLGANTYGMDYNRNYDVKGNDAYNGKYDPKVNYVDSVSFTKQYVYDNYKMKLDEGSLELQVCFNRLREQTHVLLNLWGGIGITSYRTKSDLLDGDGKLYDFSLVDSTGNKTKTLNSYNGLIDKKYESNAYGSKNGNLVTFSPSIGLGLGYQFSPGFSMLWEYKVTFPQGINADLLDGKLATNKDFFGSNDYYHYTGLNLVFTLRGKKKTTTPKTETVHTTVPTNTISAPTTSIAPPTNTIVTNVPPTQTPVNEVKPLITFITPPTSGLIVNTQQYKISAQVLNIKSINQIQFKFNGISRNNFTYNAQTHILEYNAGLNDNANSVQIIATNNAGVDNKSASILYEHPRPAVAPVVTYINPVQPGAVSSTAAYQIKAQVLNVSGQNEISVYFNGLSTPFTYDATIKQVTVPVTLNTGSNSISITANNAAGEDTKVSSVALKERKISQVGAPPVVNLINPASEINATDNLLYNFKLSVLNVSGKAGIQLLFNGAAQTNFSYDPNTKEVFFQTNLIVGNNNVSVKGTNQFGSDIKQINVNYTPHAEIKLPPVITFINPASVGANFQNSNYLFKATIGNMPNANGLSVKYNGVLITNFTYDGFNFGYQAVLNPGVNNLEISATNNDGNDVKSTSVIFKQRVAVQRPPIVTILQPTATPTITTPTFDFIFKVQYASQSQIQVMFNGTPVSQFNFGNNIGTYTGKLLKDVNTIFVKATNQDGTDSKTETLVFVPQVATDTSKTQSQTSTGQTVSSKTVEICHKTSGADPQTLIIPITELDIHMSHGDSKGACPASVNPVKVLTPKTNVIEAPVKNNSRGEKPDTINKQPTTTPRKPR